MKILQNKITVGVICIVIAAVLSFVLLPSINKGKNNTITVYKLKETIPAGTRIEESMLEEKEIGSYGIPDSLIRDKEQIIGKYASCSITSDDMLLSSKLSDYAADKRLDNVMESGRMLVTVSLDSVAAAVGNHLQAGDIVSIISYADNRVNAYEELENIEVYSVENDDAQSLDDVENNDEAEHIASTVTLIANQEQAERLIYAEYSEKVHAVFVRRGAMG